MFGSLVMVIMKAQNFGQIYSIVQPTSAICLKDGMHLQMQVNLLIILVWLLL